jgi:hypothetical protein
VVTGLAGHGVTVVATGVDTAAAMTRGRSCGTRRGGQLAMPWPRHDVTVVAIGADATVAMTRGGHAVRAVVARPWPRTWPDTE